jgi:hypothetical protein
MQLRIAASNLGTYPLGQVKVLHLPLSAQQMLKSVAVQLTSSHMMSAAVARKSNSGGHWNKGQ